MCHIFGLPSTFFGAQRRLRLKDYPQQAPKFLLDNEKVGGHSVNRSSQNIKAEKLTTSYYYQFILLYSFEQSKMAERFLFSHASYIRFAE
jgi:hypothetical protein